MFIVVHQIDELWFKLILREMVAVRGLFARAPVPEQALASAVRGIRRMEAILHQLAAHFALMETMTTRDYLAFRDKLSPASGFQSAQLREIEILLGLPDAERIPLGHEQTYFDALRDDQGRETAASRRVQARLVDRPSLVEAIGEWLHRTPIQGSLAGQPGDAERVRAFIDAYCATHAGALERVKSLAMLGAKTEADARRLEQRYEKERVAARAYLLAEDAPEGERARVSRIRAALVLIESYRELPLLAWPREVIDAIVALDSAKAQLSKQVADNQTLDAKTRAVRAALAKYLLATYGAAAVQILGDFGMQAPRTPGYRTTEEKARASAKAVATRKARVEAAKNAVAPAPAATSTKS